MSLVENLISQISSSGIGGAVKPQGLDLGDTSFADLLEKRLGNITDSTQTGILNQLGAPAGMLIEPFDDNTINEISQTEKLNNIEEPFEIKDLNIENFFSSVLSNETNSNNLMNFAKKHAANAYNVFAKSYVTDIQDFVSDITALAQ